MIPSFKLKAIYQMGFVVRDIEEAMAHFRDRFGIEKFRLLRRSEDLSTAHAYAGDMMIELVQVTPNGPPVFAPFIPEAPKISVLHHYAHAVTSEEDWNDLSDAIKQSGLKYSQSRNMDGDLNVFFVDTRDETGVFSEYVYRKGTALTMYDDVPRNDPI